MARYGLQEENTSTESVRFTGNDELDKREAEIAKEIANKTEQQNKPEITALAGHIRGRFGLAVTAKQPIQEEMLKSLRQRNGAYENDILQAIEKQGGTKIYMMITDQKCRALESYLKDILLPVGDKPFHLDPTPVPDVPPEIAKEAWKQLGIELRTRLTQQYGQFDPSMLTPEMLREEGQKLKDELINQMKELAQDAADEITDIVNDELTEGGWYQALSDVISDISTYPTGFIVGPTYRKKKVIEWQPIEGSQLSQISVIDKIIKEYDRFDPFDVYPAPGAKSIQDGDLCLRWKYQRKDLLEMKGIPGYDEKTIDTVLDLYGQKGFKDFIYSDTEYADLQNREMESTDPTGWIDGVKFFGSVQGSMLIQWGMSEEKIQNPLDDYNVTAILIGNYVIMARINQHPLGKRGIYSASFKRKTGSIWGQAPPQLIRDIQDFCNASVRAMCNNYAVASGPQVWINAERVPPGTDITEIYPWKIWPFNNPKTGASGSSDRPMDFYQPQLITGDLMEAFDYFFKQASEISGIPAYQSENLRGAGSTARGLAMLRNDAARGIRNVARNIDEGIISKSVEEHWLSIILSDPTKAKGDCKIVARASEYLVQQEQLELKRGDFLANTNNPVDLEIMGIDGRMELLKENIRGLKMNVDKIIPPKDKMIQNMVNQQTQDIIMKLSNALGVAPEEIMAVLDAASQPGGGQQLQGQLASPQQGGGDPNMDRMDVMP